MTCSHFLHNLVTKVTDGRNICLHTGTTVVLTLSLVLAGEGAKSNVDLEATWSMFTTGKVRASNDLFDG